MMETPSGKAVVITGTCGGLGMRLVRRLHRRWPVVSVDAREFPLRPKDVAHHRIEFWRKRFREVLRQQPVAAVVHLVGYHDEQSARTDRTDNVAGFQRLLNHVRSFGIGKLVLVSSATLYGARPDNPQLLSEESPLLGVGTSGHLRGLAELDMLAQSYLWKHSHIDTVVLRPVHVLGPFSNVASDYLRLSRTPTLMGFDPMVQLVHIDDVVSAVELALSPGVRGVFNIAGSAPIAVSRAIEYLGRQRVPVPYALAKATLHRAWRLGASASPAVDLEQLRYVCMVDDSKARSSLSYEPRYSVQATLEAVDEEGWP